MGKKVLKGRAIIAGNVLGKSLISSESFMFAHGVEPRTGDIVDKKSDIYRKNMKGKIFIFPYGKGSTSGSMWFLETIRRGNAPKAIINQETEMIIATGAILGYLLYGTKIAIIDKINIEALKNLDKSSNIEINKNTIWVL